MHYPTVGFKEPCKDLPIGIIKSCQDCKVSRGSEPRPRREGLNHLLSVYCLFEHSMPGSTGVVRSLRSSAFDDSGNVSKSVRPAGLDTLERVSLLRHPQPHYQSVGTHSSDTRPHHGPKSDGLPSRSLIVLSLISVPSLSCSGAYALSQWACTLVTCIFYYNANLSIFYISTRDQFFPTNRSLFAMMLFCN